MSIINKKTIYILAKLKDTGFFSIFSASVVCKILSFLGGMIIVRVLSKGDYGQYTYIMNCYGIITIMADLGCSMAALQSCNESHNSIEKSDAFFVYGYTRGILFSVFTSAIILVSPVFYPFKSSEAANLTQLLFLMPIIKTTYSFATVNLRIRLENGKYALVNVFHSFITYLVIVPLSYYIGIVGAVVSEYIINICAVIFCILISRSCLSFHNNKKIVSKKEKKDFIKLAVGTQLNTGLDTFLSMLDIFLIGIFVANLEILSSYRVASTIPLALAFIPVTLMVYVVPYFARNKSDIKWVYTYCKKLTLGCAIGNGIITLTLILVSPVIIPLLFGVQYTDSILCFCILMIGYFFSGTFRVPSANIIYTQRKVRVNIVITVATGIVKCIASIFLIYNYGSVGAAVATSLAHCVNGVLSYIYIRQHLKNKFNNQN